MPTICVSRTHTLPHKKAKDAAEEIARDLKARFALDYAWNGDTIEFERPGVTGTLRVKKDCIELDVSLGLLLTPLKASIEREIGAQLDRAVAEKPTAVKRATRSTKA
jgi:putative polyhydroxyalkanoate system protein